jgi:uncharacterized protein (TIGR02284 family)
VNDEVESVLNELIETSIDGEKAFSKGAEDAHDPELKKLFAECASRCQLGASELQSQVQVQGGPPKTAGSLKGSLHRGWTGVKQALSSRDDKAILEECERGEDHAKATYKKSLAKALPPQIRSIVERQYQGVIVNHDRVRALRDRYRETES